MRQMKTIIGCSVLLGIFSCTKEGIHIEAYDHGNISFTPTIETIIENNCIACHESGSSVPLDDYNAIQLTVTNGSLIGCLESTVNPETNDFFYHRGFPTLDSLSADNLWHWTMEQTEDN